MLPVEYFSILIFLFSSVILQKIIFIKDSIDPNIDVKNCSYFIQNSDFRVFALRAINGRLSLSFSFSNFRSFDQINLTCLLSERILYKEFILLPGKRLIFDNTLSINFGSKYLSSETIFKFSKLKGIDCFSSPLYSLSKNTKVTIEFYFSVLLLYSNNSKIKKCEDKNLTPFQNVKAIRFSTSVKYFPNTCPYIFSNLSLEKLIIHGVSDVFLKKNYLSFQKAEEIIYLKIGNLFFKFYKYKLNKELFSKSLFENTNSLTLSGNFEEAEKDCLLGFKYLSVFFIELINLNVILSKNSDWFFNYLNQVENYLHLQFVFLNSYFYSFPDEDFCLFQKFPKNKPIYPKIPVAECTCTISWIFQNNDSLIYKKISELNFNICDNVTCNFDKMMEKCTNLPKNNFFFQNKIDILHETSKIAFINLSLSPIFCISGILMNIINLWILSKKNQSVLIKKILRKLMILNSIMNLLYCLIYLFHLINICIFFTGIYCSRFYQSVFAQIYDIYFVEFFNSIFKTLSNISMVLISLDRYLLLKENTIIENFFSKWHKRRNIYKIPILVLTLAAIIYLHSIRIWTSSINNSKYLINEYYLEKEFPIKYYFKFLSSIKLGRDISSEIDNEYLFSYAIFILDFILNDVILYIFIVAIDVLLVFQMKPIFQKRLQFLKSSNKNKVKVIEKSEQNIKIGLYLNLFVLLILRLLEFGILVYVFVGILIFSSCTILSKICTNLLEFSKLFYLLSCSHSTIIYCFLSESFRIELIGIWKNLVKITRKENSITGNTQTVKN